MKTPMLSVLALATALSACGGGDEPLVAAQGHDRRVATAAPQQASEAQAQALEMAWNGDVIRVELDGGDDAAADLAVMTAYGLQAAQDLPNSAPVLVRGSDPAQVQRVADRLLAGGYPNVWQVTL